MRFRIAFYGGVAVVKTFPNFHRPPTSAFRARPLPRGFGRYRPHGVFAALVYVLDGPIKSLLKRKKTSTAITLLLIFQAGSHAISYRRIFETPPGKHTDFGFSIFLEGKFPVLRCGISNLNFQNPQPDL